MAFLQINFNSNALGKAAAMYAVMPQEHKEPLKVLWLLHGLSDDNTIWLRRTAIERYADGHNVAVFMPDGARSFYCDVPGGLKYETHIAEELPVIARSMFRLSDRREDNFIAGLSMGGYGAFKLALHHPDRYAAAASFSGVLDVGAFYRDYAKAGVADIMADFGNADPTGGREDVMALLRDGVKNGTPLPRLYQECGTEDFLYGANVKFRDLARSLGVDLEYRERPGAHSWDFWDVCIKKTMDWMGL